MPLDSICCFQEDTEPDNNHWSEMLR